MLQQLEHCELVCCINYRDIDTIKGSFKLKQTHDIGRVQQLISLLYIFPVQTVLPRLLKGVTLRATKPYGSLFETAGMTS
jgi:hypothetical protein